MKGQAPAGKSGKGGGKAWPPVIPVGGKPGKPPVSPVGGKPGKDVGKPSAGALPGKGAGKAAMAPGKPVAVRPSAANVPQVNGKEHTKGPAKGAAKSPKKASGKGVANVKAVGKSPGGTALDQLERDFNDWVDHLINCFVNLDVVDEEIDAAVFSIKQLRRQISKHHEQASQGAKGKGSAADEDRQRSVEQILWRVGELCQQAGDECISTSQVGNDPVILELKHGAVASIGKLLRSYPEYFELFIQEGSSNDTLIRMVAQPPKRSYQNKRKHPDDQLGVVPSTADGEEMRLHIAQLCVAHLHESGGELDLGKLAGIPEISEARKGQKGVVKSFSLFLQKFPETFELYKLTEDPQKPPKDMARLIGPLTVEDEGPTTKRPRVTAEAEALSPEDKEQQQEFLLAHIVDLCREAGGELKLQDIGQDETVKALRNGLGKVAHKLKNLIALRPDILILEDHATGPTGVMQNTMVKLAPGI